MRQYLGIYRLLTLVGMMWGVGVSPLMANPTEIFSVPQVPVAAEADTSAEAKQIAQSQGRKQALDILLRRLTAEEDWGYLPSLATNTAAKASVSATAFDEQAYGGGFDGGLPFNRKQPVVILPDDLPQLEQGFAIFDEKASGNSYRAKITYRFKPDGIRQILESAALPYSEAQARPALILPVLETEDGLYLWETKNPWARAWLARPLVNELTPLILPNGDAEDIATLTVDQAKGLEAEYLGPLASRYGVDQIILAQGSLKQVEGEFRFSVKLIDAYFAGRGEGRGPITAATAATLYDSPSGYGQAPVANASIGSKGSVLASTFFRGATNDFPALAKRAVESTVAKYARDWKEQTLVDHSAVRPLSLTAWFGSLDEWAQIRGALENTSLVREMKVGAFNNENAVMDLVLIGEQNQLLLAMRQRDLSIWQGPDGRWNIASFERADELQAQSETVSSLEGINQPLNQYEGNAVPQNSIISGAQEFRQRPQGRPLGYQGAGGAPLALPEDIFGAPNGGDVGNDLPGVLDNPSSLIEGQSGVPMALEPVMLEQDPFTSEEREQSDGANERP
ncbi:MAG: DUF2066 domain-containing protein [Pseudomonadota bacterium]